MWNLGVLLSLYQREVVGGLSPLYFKFKRETMDETLLTNHARKDQIYPRMKALGSLPSPLGEVRNAMGDELEARTA